jgi:hypothetical protein
LHHKLAIAKAGAICECQHFPRMCFYHSSPIPGMAKAICESSLAGGKGPAAAGKTPLRLHTCHKSPRNVTFAETKLLVAAGQTPTGQIHLIKSCECHFCQKGSACCSQGDLPPPRMCPPNETASSRCEDLSRADTCHRTREHRFHGEKHLQLPE